MDQSNDKMKHLLVILLEVLSTDPSNGPSRSVQIQDKAEAAGLSESDVQGLLEWIENHMLPHDEPEWPRDPVPDAPSDKAFRYFSEADARYLTPEGMGYLVGLVNNKQISRAQLEALLAYASYVAYRPMDIYDLEPIIEQVLFMPGRPGMTGGASEGFENIH
ncbi:MAG: DUF494 family protein [Candidatus Krumholzibacteria bacterium]|nr:DUF494 family protein [Candidatus Krumholzibacteria bacterium]